MKKKLIFMIEKTKKYVKCPALVQAQSFSADWCCRFSLGRDTHTHTHNNINNNNNKNNNIFNNNNGKRDTGTKLSWALVVFLGGVSEDAYCINPLVPRVQKMKIRDLTLNWLLTVELVKKTCFILALTIVSVRD